VEDGGKRSASCSGHFVLGQEPQYALNRRLGGPQSWSGRFRKGRNFVSPTGIWTRTV